MLSMTNAVIAPPPLIGLEHRQGRLDVLLDRIRDEAAQERDALDQLRDALQRQQEEAERNQQPRRPADQAAGVAGDLAADPGVHEDRPGQPHDEEAHGQQEEDGAEDVDPHPGAASRTATTRHRCGCARCAAACSPAQSRNTAANRYHCSSRKAFELMLSEIARQALPALTSTIARHEPQNQAPDPFVQPSIAREIVKSRFMVAWVSWFVPAGRARTCPSWARGWPDSRR